MPSLIFFEKKNKTTTTTKKKTKTKKQQQTNNNIRMSSVAFLIGAFRVKPTSDLKMYWYCSQKNQCVEKGFIKLQSLLKMFTHKI